MEEQKVIINTALLNKTCLEQLCQYPAEIFTEYKYRLIHSIMKDYYDAGTGIDLPVLVQELKNRNKYNSVGGDDLLLSISSCSTTIEFKKTLELMEENRIREELKNACTDMFSSIKSGSMEYEDFIKKMSEINDNRIGSDGTITNMSEFVTNFNLDDMFDNSHYIKSNIPEIDKNISFGSGQTIIIAGRPGQGKTSLGLQIAESFNQDGLFLSYEMKKRELYAKLLSMRASVEVNKIEMKTMNENEINRTIKAHNYYIENLKLHVEDSAAKLNTILPSIRRIVKNKKLKWIVVDYIQLVTGISGSNKNEIVSNISRAFKLLAMELNIPIIILSQMNREIEKTTREPVLSDLRDSGCLHGDTKIFNYSHKSISKIKMLDGSSGIDVLSIRKENCEVAKMSKGFNSGIKELNSLETATGHKILATGNHKFLTMEDGWKRLDELSEKDMIAIPLSLKLNENKHGRDLSEARFIAMMLANGCMLKNRSYQYTSNLLDEDLCDQIILDSVKIMNGQISPYKKATYFKNRGSKWMNVFFPKNTEIIKSNKNPLTNYLKDVELYNKRTKEKTIPGFVYYESEEFRKEFIKYLFSTDGTISIQKKQKIKINISYSSTSYELITGLQFLLQSVGILSTLKQVKQKRDNKTFTWYNLSIYSNYFQKKYLNEIGFAGSRKQKIQKESMDILMKIYPGWTKYVLNKEKTIAFVEIKNIEKLKIKESTYDITVPETSNFIANGIIVHNSLEQDTSIVLFLHDNRIIVAKNRKGPIGDIEGLYFEKQYSRFIPSNSEVEIDAFQYVHD